MSKYHNLYKGFQKVFQAARSSSTPKNLRGNISTTIVGVAPKVNKTTLDKSKSALAKQMQKTKASAAKLKQTLFESKNKAFKGDDFTFGKSSKKSESNKERYKRVQGENTKVLKSMIDKATENKANGGRIGRRFGGDTMPKRKTNVQKIKETFGPKKNVPNKFKGFSKLPEAVQQKINKKLAKKV
jgi:hypothetical protein